MANCKEERLTLILKDYVIEIAEQKARINFDDDLNAYFNWLICTNNKREISQKIKELEEVEELLKPDMLPDSAKVAMYENTCKYCNKPIFPGDEICKAQEYENYIHRKCCKKL